MPIRVFWGATMIRKRVLVRKKDGKILDLNRLKAIQNSAERSESRNEVAETAENAHSDWERLVAEKIAGRNRN